MTTARWRRGPPVPWQPVVSLPVATDRSRHGAGWVGGGERLGDDWHRRNE